MRGRKLDREITFQVNGQFKDPKLGTVKKGGWVDYGAPVAASVLDILPSKSEQLDETINIAKRPARIRIRYRDDITGTMRILYRGRIMEIISGPVEIGRAEWLEMVAQEYSTAGDPA